MVRIVLDLASVDSMRNIRVRHLDQVNTDIEIKWAALKLVLLAKQPVVLSKFKRERESSLVTWALLVLATT
jgi:hypothetical protein